MATQQQQVTWLGESVGVHVTNDRVAYARGEEAVSWLNGQVTNDVRELSEERAVYALAATIKGRVITDLWALKKGDEVIVVLPDVSAEAALASFEEHIIMEDVELALDESLRVITVQGPRAAELRINGPEFVLRYACPRFDGAGFDVICRASELQAWVTCLGDKARELGGGLVDEDAFRDALVLKGISRMGDDFGPDNYPQEAGLKSQALSFSKGCYLGQEVIYMLENRGQLARKLVQLEGEGDISRGLTIVDDQGKRLGEVTSVAVTKGPGGATYALGYVKRAHAELDARVVIEGRQWRVSHVVGVTNAPCPIVAH
jgi:folate-binding protein YgfZ